MRKWKVAPEQIKTTIFNLSRNETEECKITPPDIERIKVYMRGSIRDMKALLKDVERNTVEENDFPKTQDERKCAKCKFRKVC